MSRTDKDRPDWVRLNDSMLEMEYRHNHLNFDREEDYGTDYVYFQYHDHCTAYEVIPQKPIHSNSFVYGGIRSLENLEFPCARRQARYKNDKLHYRLDIYLAPYYHKEEIRVQERVFLRNEAKRYNSNYLSSDEYFMDDNVFTTQFGEQGMSW